MSYKAVSSFYGFYAPFSLFNHLWDSELTLEGSTWLLEVCSSLIRSYSRRGCLVFWDHLKLPQLVSRGLLVFKISVSWCQTWSREAQWGQNTRAVAQVITEMMPTRLLWLNIPLFVGVWWLTTVQNPTYIEENNYLISSAGANF